LTLCQVLYMVALLSTRWIWAPLPPHAMGK
jgi:hypothetical protein